MPQANNDYQGGCITCGRYSYEEHVRGCVNDPANDPDAVQIHTGVRTVRTVPTSEATRSRRPRQMLVSVHRTVAQADAMLHDTARRCIEAVCTTSENDPAQVLKALRMAASVLSLATRVHKDVKIQRSPSPSTNALEMAEKEVWAFATDVRRGQ
jgi:hypothetical protein